MKRPVMTTLVVKWKISA